MKTQTFNSANEVNSMKLTLATNVLKFAIKGEDKPITGTIDIFGNSIDNETFRAMDNYFSNFFSSYNCDTIVEWIESKGISVERFGSAW